MSELVVLAVVAVVVVYVVLALIVYFRQASYVYVPDSDVDLTPANANMAYEDVRLRTQDGHTIAGWFVPAFGPGEVAVEDGRIAGTTVLMCHGNGGNIAGRLDSILVFHKWRMNVFIFDYRGYGDSTGRPTEKGTYCDARTAWNYLTVAREIPSDRILVYGRSLGCAIAAWLAVEEVPSALVLESGFTSAPDMALRMFPYLPGHLIARFKYDTINRIGAIRCPILIAHSPNDATIPYEQGQRLFAAANKPKQFIELSGGHNDGGLDCDIAYQRALREFLECHLAHKGP